MTASDPVRQELSDLHESYVYQLNVALEEGRKSIASELSAAYTDEALAVILGEDPAQAAGRGRLNRVKRPRRRRKP